MEQKAIEILDQNRLMALATNRADGWPQNTMVGYANDGLLLYFVVSRESQKFANIQKDDRVSIVVGRDFHDPATIKALSMAARASEVTDAKQREQAVGMLLQTPSWPRQTRATGVGAFRRDASISRDRHHPRLLKRIRPRRRAHRLSWRDRDGARSGRRLGIWRGAQAGVLGHVTATVRSDAA
jgi:nitroimidazol reductase NimA-like FMN-containing flavoprotein (pyridoxamine 5'-phosphate oxidase superfamily)